MAHMYPTPINPVTKSSAERVLYAALSDQLDDSYTVFHGKAWLAKDAAGRPHDGEADFVIAHPTRGILVVEVKGGIIRCEPRSGIWVSIDHAHETHPIKDPFAQARYSRYALEDALNGYGETSRRSLRQSFNIGYAVAFPDVFVAEECLGPEMPQDIIMQSTDLPNVAHWVGATLAYWRGRQPKVAAALGERVVERLVELLGKSWES